MPRVAHSCMRPRGMIDFTYPKEAMVQRLRIMCNSYVYLNPAIAPWRHTPVSDSIVAP